MDWVHSRRLGMLCLKDRKRLRSRSWGRQMPFLRLNTRRGCWRFCFTWGTTRSTLSETSQPLSKPGLRGTAQWYISACWGSGCEKAERMLISLICWLVDIMFDVWMNLTQTSFLSILTNFCVSFSSFPPSASQGKTGWDTGLLPPHSNYSTS